MMWKFGARAGSGGPHTQTRQILSVGACGSGDAVLRSKSKTLNKHVAERRLWAWVFQKFACMYGDACCDEVFAMLHAQRNLCPFFGQFLALCLGRNCAAGVTTRPSWGVRFGVTNSIKSFCRFRIPLATMFGSHSAEVYT